MLPDMEQPPWKVCCGKNKQEKKTGDHNAASLLKKTKGSVDYGKRTEPKQQEKFNSELRKNSETEKNTGGKSW